MRAFRNIPINQKLMLIIMATTAAALLVSGIGIVIADSILFRNYLERDLSTLARITADNTTAALAFEDPRSAAETLNALRAREHLTAACVYRMNGTVLATYLRAGAVAECPPNSEGADINFTHADLIASRPVLLNGRRIGALVLRYDLGEIYERMALYGATVLGVLLLSSLVGFAVSSRLRAVIATPISSLASAASSVSATRDYSIRAQKLSGDELGVLVDAFNEMLARIQSRDDELKQALLAREEALKDAQNARDSLKTTLASIGDAVISTDVSGCVVFANRVAQALLRSAEPGIIGQHLYKIFPIINEFSRVKVEDPVTQILRNGAFAGPLEHTLLVGEDGTEIPIDYSGAPIRGDTGTLHGTVLVFRNATSRRRAEETSRLLASIVESSNDAIIGRDLKGTVTSWNRGAERIFGYPSDEMLGRPLSVIADPGHPDEMEEAMVRIVNGEAVGQYQAIRRTKSGDLIHASITVSPLHDALGRMIGASEIARDITGQVRAAERLAQLNADLVRSNIHLARSNEDLARFAFVASHDLQEPLRMITVYSQLLVKTYPPSLDKQADNFVANIVGGTRRMRELLADLLAYTEIGARQDEPASKVDLNAALEKVLQNLQASIDENTALVTYDELPVYGAHEGDLIPLFQNLIGNAIKYRSAEPPRIHISVEERGEQLQFMVSDNGIGIAPEYHQKIFVAFKRLHGKDVPGTGIGLAICQRVVERYGGRIWVESEAGHGSKFIFTLPLNRVAERNT